MTITALAATHYDSGTGSVTSYVFTNPACVAGDFLVHVVATAISGGASAQPSAPAGWTALSTNTGVQNSAATYTTYLAIFYKIAVAADSGAGVAVSLSASAGVESETFGFHGVDPNTPIVSTPAPVTTTGVNAVTPSVTLSAGQVGVFAATTITNNVAPTVSFNAPNTIYAAGSGWSIALGAGYATGTGVVGPYTLTTNSGVAYGDVGLAFVLAPAGTLSYVPAVML